MFRLNNQPTKDQLQLFDALHQSRTEDFKIFNKKSYRGVWSSIIDKYPESAHFVYELLQNADDAEASEVQITINHQEMLFKHNGTKHFDITAEDAVPVGDINSITGIGDSSKNDVQNKIGKFGVGFKAVFQYTNIPEIYDDIFKFKIENYIIPTLLDHDHKDRKRGETLFVFPFKDGMKSFNEIVQRLDKLQNPILFLRHLNKIELNVLKNNGYERIAYEKELVDSEEYDDGIILERFTLKEPSRTSSIFLFTQDIVVTSEGKKTPHVINVGFYFDDKKKRLITDTTQNIFCFFPTKETFKTCFVSHAPFLLTDNRQNLKPSENLNTGLIRLLSKLAAKSLLFLRDYGIAHKHLLIDDNLTEIVPVYKKNYWSPLDDTFERPMKEAFDEVLSNEAIFLSRNGKYLTKEDACLGTPKELVDLLSQKQLSDLLSSPKDFLKWELIQNINKINSDVFSDEIEDFNSARFARLITASFMADQEMRWVTRFYTYLRNYAPKLWKISLDEKLKDYSQYPFRTAPIIKTQKGDWVSPYLEDKTRNVYLPLKKDSESAYNFIHEEYLKNENSKKFFEELDIKEPDEYDYINAVILNKYRGASIQGEHEDIVSDIEILVSYYKKVKGTSKEEPFINTVKGNLYLRCEDEYYRPAYNIFVPNPNLREYLAPFTVFFLDVLYYKDSLVKTEWNDVYSFFHILGASSYPKISINKKYDFYSFSQRIRSQFAYSDVSEAIFTDKELSFFEILINKKKMTKSISLYLWNDVLPSIGYEKYSQMCVDYRKKYARYFSTKYIDSTFKDSLIRMPWIYDESGEVFSAPDIPLETLAAEYNRNNGLINFLGIEKKEKSILELGGTEEQQTQMDLGKRIKKLAGEDLSEQEILDAIAEARAKKNAHRQPSADRGQITKPTEAQTRTTPKASGSDDEPEEVDGTPTIEDKLNEKWKQKANERIKRPRPAKNPEEGITNEITPNSTEISSNQPFFDDKNTSRNNGETSEAGKDDQTAERRLKSKNTEAQESAQKASELVQILDLLRSTEKYTFKWYKLLMELMHANKSNINERHAQIDFSQWELTCSDKVIHLSNPSAPVPAWFAEAERYTISTLSDKPSIIDGLIVKADEYSLDLSIEIDDQLMDICKKAKKIRVVADNSTNFIDSFEKRFLQLGYEDNYNLSKNLPKDVTFIYGPPGTGKTTEVVQMVHNILSSSTQKTNILVLTPTNKAADVVAEKMVDDDVCFSYLTRFGSTESLYLIEDAAVVCNRDTTDMDLLDHNILVTTAARYAYDCVQPDDVFICDYDWDYIIIDEASMMDLLTSTYILFKGSNSKIIISGDPMQIQPVTQNDMPAYNVYDLVGLHGFSDAIKNYTKYPVIALQTQHRSIPSIGNIVSKFSYNGLVKSDPNRAPQKPLSLDGMNVRDLNFFGYDVKDFDLVTGLGAIGGSAFQLYAAIFTYKMAEYLVTQISSKYPGKNYSIGIVCPYRAEADAIKQMLDNRPIHNDDISVSCGTVHSFQGDECDIMFVVLNPPAQCSSGSHINNHNIINVAMSRARDYLFFVLPNGQQKGFTLKNDLGRLTNITQRQVVNCSKLEEIMFGQPNYIVANTHVTCHMPVNVYCEDTAIYEVRMSDEALDIKINED